MQKSFDTLVTPAKKILWLENGEILGGAELFSLDMLSQLSHNFSQPIEITYYSDTLHPLLQSRIEKIQKQLPEYITLQIEISFLPRLEQISFTTFWNAGIAIQKLIKKIRTERYDVVHANTVRTGFFLSMAGKFCSAKTSFFAHDYTAPKKWLRWGMGTFHQIFACSYPVKEYMHTAGVSYEKIHVIENAVDPEIFSHIAKKSLQKIETVSPTQFGILGRITPWKGQLVVLKAIENLVKEYGEHSFDQLHFHFFGEPSHKKSDKEFFLRLQHFVSENQLDHMVTFHGFTDINKALKKIDVLIHAAQEAEPFGRTPLEGAISGKTLLLSRLGTPSQIFSKNIDAFFFTPKDAEALSDQIRFIIDPENSDMVQNVTRAGYTMVKETFPLPNIAKKFWSFFYKK